jgi:transposase
VQRYGRTVTRWRHQISAWHRAKFTNGPTEAVNNLVKRVKKVAFGITNWTNYPTRALLYPRRPNGTLLSANSR